MFTKSPCGKQVKCSICECWLPSGAEKFISSHVSGRKHKQQLERKREKEKTTQCSLYVKGFNALLPDLEQELIEYFEDFGSEVKDVYIDKNVASYAIIEFTNKEHVDKVFSCEKPLFHEKKLVIKKRETSKKISPATCESKTEEACRVTCLLPIELEDKLNEEQNVVAQMNLLMEFFKLSHEEMELRKLICELLESVLEEVYPQCKVLFFGSSANGLGEKGCDVDLTLVTEFTSEDSKVHAEVREIIQRFAPGCKNVSVVDSAKACTIVKFFHTPSNLSVDLSLNNDLAIKNTELLKAYVNYDERVALILFSIRKWAKCFTFSGRNNFQISQYSITLLVIYYLQQHIAPVLPCLQECHKTDDDKIGQWNCSFCKACKKNENLGKNLTAHELLFGFFNFFSSFDFTKYVIGIHCKSPLLRSEVYATINTLDIGDPEKDLKFDSPLVVQDPFKLSHNLTHNLSASGLVLLLAAFKQAYSIQDNGSLAPLSLTALFMQKQSSKSRQKRKHHKSSFYTISLPNCHHICDKSQVICFDYVKTILVEDLRMQICKEHMKETVIGKELLELQDQSTASLEAPVTANGLKRKFDESEVDFLGVKKMKIESIECENFVASAYADTWTNRRKQRRLIQKLQQNDEIDTTKTHDENEDADSGITSDISTSQSVSSSMLNMSKSTALLHFNVTITKALDEGGVCKVKLEPQDESKNRQDFQTFYAYIKKELITVFK